MKKMVKLAMLGVMTAAGVCSLSAQSNIVRNVNIALSGVMQTGENTSSVTRVGNKEIITAISADQQGVPAKAKLLLVTPVEGEGFSVILRAKGAEDADVTSFFNQSQIGNAVVNGSTEVAIEEFVFHSSTINFDVQGYATRKNVAVRNAGNSATENASVAGNGDVNGNTAVFKGTINATGPKAE